MGRSCENWQVCTVFLTPYSVYTLENSDLLRNLINFIANDVIGKVKSLFWSLTYFCDLQLLCKVVLKNTRIQENNSGRGADIVREEKLQTFPPVNCRIAFFKLKSLLRAAS